MFQVTSSFITKMDPVQWAAALQVTMLLQCHLLHEQQALVGTPDPHKPSRPTLLHSDTLEKVKSKRTDYFINK
jgi:hypothetical protein